MPLLTRVVHPNGVVTYRSPLLHQMKIVHGFSTRIGGVSEPPFDSMNLATATISWDTEENYRRLAETIGAFPRVRRQVHQVHGCVVHVPDGSCSTIEADALVSEDPAEMLSVRVADCVPILLAASGGRVVAAVHAGWRGVIASVVPHAITTMAKRFGVKPREITAAVGPCISVAHFEVDEPVAIAFTAAGLASAVSRTRGAKPHIDLAAAVVQQLRAAGVSADAIDTTDRCTYRDVEDFYSHRRDAANSGRMAAVICARE